MKTYVYDLGDGKKEYDLDTICKALDFNVGLMTDMLTYCNDDIDRAVTRLYAEKSCRTYLEELTKYKSLFSAREICEVGYRKMNEIYNHIIEEKRRIAEKFDDFAYIKSQDWQNGYFYLDIMELLSLLINTPDKLDNPPLTQKELYSIIALGYPRGFNDNRIMKLINAGTGISLSEEEMIRSSDNLVALTKENSKTLLDLIKKHRVTVLANDMLFEYYIRIFQKKEKVILENEIKYVRYKYESAKEEYEKWKSKLDILAENHKKSEEERKAFEEEFEKEYGISYFEAVHDDSYTDVYDDYYALISDDFVDQDDPFDKYFDDLYYEGFE